MWQRETNYKSAANLTLMLALVASPLMTASLVVAQTNDRVAQAQTSTSPEQAPFPLPTSVPSGTTVRVDGSDSMARINNSLKQEFEQKFAGSKVEIGTNGSSAAIKALQDGNIDVAGIGRGLTKSELAQGLAQKLVRREKIAIVVGEKNPFQASLTNEQFAKIFRGEITDWKQLGGKPGKIRFIDRPVSSDTREAFRGYPVFKGSKFESGKNAVRLTRDDTAELVKQLGKDGIGYVIANQVSQVPGIRVLPMHQILPEDKRYPYSQPLVYAYKQNPSAGVKSFLGFAGAEPGVKAVEAARTADANAIAQSVSSTATNTPAATTTPATNATTNPTATAEATPTVVATADGQSSNNVSTNDSSNTNPSSENTQAVAPSTETGLAGEIGETKTPWFWWLLAPVLLGLGGGGLLWLLTRGSRDGQSPVYDHRQPGNLVAATTAGGLGASSVPSGDFNSGVSSAPVSAMNTANVAADTGSAPNLANLAAATGATVVGAGLWARLSQEDQSANVNPAPVSNDSVSNQIEENNVEELDRPLEVVAPELRTSDTTTLQIENQVENPIETSAENPDTPNLGDRIGDLGGVALAGGAAVLGTGLWGRLTDQSETPEVNPVDNPPIANENNLNVNNLDVNLDAPTVPDITNLNLDDNPELSSVTAETANVELANLQPSLPDVWEEVDENSPPTPTETPKPSENTGLIDNMTAAGGAAIAGGAAALTGLWGRLTNRGENPTVNPPEVNLDTSLPQVDSPNVNANNLDVNLNPPQAPEIPSLDTNLDIPQAPDISNLNAPELNPPELNPPELDTSSLDAPNLEAPNLDINVTAPQAPEIPNVELTNQSSFQPLPDVWEDASEESTPEENKPEENKPEENTQLNLVTEEPQSGVIDNFAVGGAVAGVAAAGAGFWSRFNQNEENPTPKNSVTMDTQEAPVTAVNTVNETANETDSETNNQLLTETPITDDINLTETSAETSSESSEISLTPRTPKWAHVVWNISDTERNTLQKQGGSQLALRLYDVTDMDLSYRAPQLVQQYECEETVHNRFVAIPVSDRDYMTEIGYLTTDDRWLLLARSPIVRVFNRPNQEFWFEADAELIIHGATQPGSTVNIGGNPVKVKQDGTFHLRIPFTQDIIDYIMTSVSADGEHGKTIHMHFTQEERES